MELSARGIRGLAEERSFNAGLLECMVRLYGVLDSFASDDVMAPRMALKGGTALNAFHAPLPRLSVDIDINYIGELDWTRMREDKRVFEDRFVRIMSSSGYRQIYAPPNGRGKWRFGYPDIAGGETTLQVDLSYRERMPLFGVRTLSSAPIGTHVAKDVPVLDVHEVIGGKLKALVSRVKSRDLFDTDYVTDMPGLDWRKIRCAALVLGAWQYRGDWREVGTELIKGDVTELRESLLGCLPRGYFDPMGGPERWLVETVGKCRRELAPVFEFTEGERAYLDAFLDRGKIEPGHLAAGAETEAAIRSYPALKGMAEGIRSGKFRVIGLAAQDRRRADLTLQLACAVTERVETSSGFHWGDLPDKIRERLDFSEKRRNVPRDAVRTRAAEIARKRAEADLRVRAVKELEGEPLNESGARFRGDPRFTAERSRERYEALVADGMRRLERDAVQPTDLEVAAARVEVAAKGTKFEETGRILGEALEYGTVAAAADIRAERQALLSELAGPMPVFSTSGNVRLMERLYRSFAASELKDMSGGGGSLLESLPDDVTRTRAAGNINALLLAEGVGSAPWNKLHEVLAKPLARRADRGEPARSPGRGHGIDIF